MGMQQHSKPSHSIHFVLPGSTPPGLMMDSNDAMGLTALTREVPVDCAEVYMMLG